MSKFVKKKTTENNLLVRPYPNAFFNESRNDKPKNDADLKRHVLCRGCDF